MYPNKQAFVALAARGFSMVPVGIELPADTLTPVAAFLRLTRGGRKQAFLLESADGGEQIGRFSFLGVDPFAVLTYQDNRLAYVSAFESATSPTTNPMHEIGARIAAVTAPQHPEFPPFQGGVVGYVAYDAVRFLERLPIQGDQSFPDVRLMFFKNVVAFDHLKRCFYLMTLVPTAGDRDRAYDEAEQTLNGLRARLSVPSGDESWLELPPLNDDGDELPPPAALMGAERYHAAVGQIKQAIRRGDIFQCVLSDRFALDIKADPFTIYRILRTLNPSPYLFYLAMDDSVLLGSSPEMLMRAGGGTITTRPIAGTRPRGRNAEEDKKLERDLFASVKERAEHLMLVDLGRNDIGRMAKPGTVSVDEFMKVERFSHVMHLVSTVSGKLDKRYTPWEAFCSCFPAGTLSGAPKIKAMEVIARLEATARGAYGGAVVAHDFSGNLNSCITIRSLFIKGEQGYTQAGAGIVADSRAASEYQEVLNKARAVRRAVHLANLSAKGRRT